MSLRWLSVSLTVQSEAAMAGQDGPGDDGGGVYSWGDRLGNHGSMSGGKSDRGRDDRRGDDRAEAMADGNAGQTTGIGEGDSQDGSEDSLEDCPSRFR